ncbi:DUF4385 domain-containing protein [Mucilaginibacter myungsuensis]|uniref:DUF4385 domain-containing protein n=1 Tax=Mucilaginibacter myungsuensis TaxID=649104 RepID=A0A929PY83_9SPHI|nr:DUF4385 domain-containing protein [Mucilaginibacter myungsuensis]MBE9663185.1 DUF4385 domain-containing protein [Mucilaginibacter myungsuensis]MDN3598820.1 DUF4385 domain-containing protein [Mucilaginibacter myungsuensis]
MRKGTPTCPNFNNEKYAWKPDVDYRKHPELYRIGKGEQGVLICEPYKSEIGQNWRSKTEVIAVESSDKIYVQFLDYLASNDFVGADMARKYLQMGYTRARRHANYKGGRKYDAENKYALLERGTGEQVKAKADAIFYAKWKAAEHHQTYAAMKTD